MAMMVEGKKEGENSKTWPTLKFYLKSILDLILK